MLHFFWCVTFCYNGQNCNDRVSIVNKPHQLFSPYGGGEHSEPGGTPSPQTHVGAPLHQTAFAVQVAVTRLGTLSDWLGQGEGSSRNQAFRLPPNHSTCPPGPDRFVTSGFVIQLSNPESSRDLNHSTTIRTRWILVAHVPKVWQRHLHGTRAGGARRSTPRRARNVRVDSFFGPLFSLTTSVLCPQTRTRTQRTSF